MNIAAANAALRLDAWLRPAVGCILRVRGGTALVRVVDHVFDESMEGDSTWTWREDVLIVCLADDADETPARLVWNAADMEVVEIPEGVPGLGLWPRSPHLLRNGPPLEDVLDVLQRMK